MHRVAKFGAQSEDERIGQLDRGRDAVGDEALEGVRHPAVVLLALLFGCAGVAAVAISHRSAGARRVPGRAGRGKGSASGTVVSASASTAASSALGGVERRSARTRGAPARGGFGRGGTGRALMGLGASAPTAAASAFAASSRAALTIWVATFRRRSAPFGLWCSCRRTGLCGLRSGRCRRDEPGFPERVAQLINRLVVRQGREVGAREVCAVDGRRCSATEQFEGRGARL